MGHDVLHTKTMTLKHTKIGVNLPTLLRDGVNEVCDRRGIPDRAEYIRSLIREDLEREGIIKRGEA